MRAVLFCFIAEFFCNHGMITGNHFMNVIETTLWNIALGGLIPDTLKLFLKSKEIFDNHPEIDASQVNRYILCCLICFIIFVVQVSFDHMPTQYKLWKEGQLLTETIGNPHDYNFWDGLKSTLFDRTVS